MSLGSLIPTTVNFPKLRHFKMGWGIRSTSDLLTTTSRGLGRTLGIGRYRSKNVRAKTLSVSAIYFATSSDRTSFLTMACSWMVSNAFWSLDDSFRNFKNVTFSFSISSSRGGGIERAGEMMSSEVTRGSGGGNQPLWRCSTSSGGSSSGYGEAVGSRVTSEGEGGVTVESACGAGREDNSSISGTIPESGSSLVQLELGGESGVNQAVPWTGSSWGSESSSWITNIPKYDCLKVDLSIWTSSCQLPMWTLLLVLSQKGSWCHHLEKGLDMLPTLICLHPMRVGQRSPFWPLQWLPSRVGLSHLAYEHSPKKYNIGPSCAWSFDGMSNIWWYLSKMG